MWSDRKVQEKYGLRIGDFDFEQLVFCNRLRDDASVASHAACALRLEKLFRIVWNIGSGSDVPVKGQGPSLEEEGEQIRFLDTIERVVGVTFFLRPLHHNSPVGRSFCAPFTTTPRGGPGLETAVHS